MKIISTVGTSIFENYFKNNPKSPCFKVYTERLKKVGHSYSQWEECKGFREEVKKCIKEGGILSKDASAEIASILKIVKEIESEKISIHFLATDTVLSVLAAEMITEWFKDYSAEDKIIVPQFIRPKLPFEDQKSSNHLIKDLQINSNKSYQEGFMNLIHILNTIVESKNNILNITGGYKAIIPIVTLLGQIKEIPLKYIYDESELSDDVQLITIGKLPFSFDWSLAELHLDNLSRDGLKKINSKPETLDYLRKINLIQKNAYKLTPLGSLFVNHLKDQLTGKKSTLGYLVELKVFEYFTQQEQNTIRGKAYWWDVGNRSFYNEEAQYNQDDKKEQKIDLDIFIKKSISEEWYEVKSCSKTGLNKAFKQFKVMLDFIEKTSYTDVQKIGLILYKLSTTDVGFYQKRINNIRELFKESPLQLSIQYIDIPETEDGLFNTKRFFERNLTLIQLE